MATRTRPEHSLFLQPERRSAGKWLLRQFLLRFHILAQLEIGLPPAGWTHFRRRNRILGRVY
ncbi:hypothetical protein BDZ45DRAFT_677966 [Acephala macrosclerotiorum]|nr:hypothetical protein BDZ45DRAFT_677966 [Acephala macrosclerotiorum]